MIPYSKPAEARYTLAMASLSAFLAVARAPFLLLPVTLIAVGTMAARLEAPVSWSRAILALAGLISLHMAVNIFNELSDMRRGIDLETTRTPFSGGSGALPAGLISMKTALVFGIVCSLAGLLVGIYFFRIFGLPMLILMVAGAGLVIGYTDLLARIGVGEIAAGLGLGGLPVIGAALVQHGYPGPAALAAAVPATLMTFNLLLLNEFPDEEADRRGGRRNLLLLFGRRVAARAYVLALCLTPLSLVGAILAGFLPPVSLLAAGPSLLLVRPAILLLRNPEDMPPLSSLAANVKWNLMTNTILALCLFVEQMPS